MTATDNRRFVEAVLHRYRAGIPWRDLSERFGDLIKGFKRGFPVGPSLVSGIGFSSIATPYCGVGLALTLTIALRWQAVLWPLRAQANARRETAYLPIDKSVRELV